MSSSSTVRVQEASMLGKMRARRGHGYRAQRVVGRTLIYLLLVAGSVLFLAPLLWMIGSSLKPEGEVFLFPPTFFPSTVQWDNYPYALGQFPFLRSLANTMVVVVGVGVGRLVTASLVAFGFARVRFPLRNALFLLVLSTMMIPYHVTLIPQYLIFRNLRWLDSLRPLVVPAFFGGGAFYVFLLRQFFLTIPKDYDDAARIDGCGTFGIFWRIILPQSLPALGTLAIFTFMATWNDFLAPLIYLNPRQKHTSALGFRQWEANPLELGRHHKYSHTVAIATLITLFLIVMFFTTQRHFIQGVVVSGVKG